MMARSGYAVRFPREEWVPENKAHRPSAGARVAAVVALLTLVAAAGLVLIGVVQHFAAVLAGLACLLICVMAGWYAVSRRGIVRVVALTVAVAAVAGLITSLVFEDFHGLAVVRAHRRGRGVGSVGPLRAADAGRAGPRRRP